MNPQKRKPQIKKKEAKALAEKALTDPLGVLSEIAKREQHAAVELFLMYSYNTCSMLWLCKLTFTGALYGAKGAGTTPSEAVKIALLRAYDTGSEKGWQLRDKSFTGEAS